MIEWTDAETDIRDDGFRFLSVIASALRAFVRGLLKIFIWFEAIHCSLAPCASYAGLNRFHGCASKSMCTTEGFMCS